MASIQKYLFFLLPVLLISSLLPAQNSQRISTVKQIYEMLQAKSGTSKDVAGLIPGTDLEQVKNEKGMNTRYTISFPAILEREWVSVVFRDLQYSTPTQDAVLVTGTVQGIKADECDYISTDFNHYWFFKNGKIIKFSEQDLSTF